MKIPEKFNNSLEEKPFSHCKLCDKELLESNSEYLIEKAYKRFPEGGGEELLFEIAICLECAMNMRSTLSKQSLANVQQFFFKKGMERRQQLVDPESFAENPLRECLLSGKPFEETREYQIYAHCRGGDISMDGGYYMLSDEIIEEMQSLLSKETRDELERFSDDNLGVPPELKKLFSRGDLITI